MIGATGSTPEHIHITLQNSDPSTSVTISWRSDSETGMVLYDTDPHDGAPDHYTEPIEAEAHILSGTSLYIHDAELTGLAPGATYYFICGSEEGGWSRRSGSWKRR